MNYFKGIAGNLLPEQLRYFTEGRDLADVLDRADDFFPPYHIYLNGEYLQSRDDINVYTAVIAINALKKQYPDARIVVLDDLGQIVHNEGDEPRLSGQFQLVYTIESHDCEGLWDFFEGGFSHLLNNDDNGTNVLSLSTGELTSEPFADVVDFERYPQELREYIINLQRIARLYPLLEIKLYRN